MENELINGEEPEVIEEKQPIMFPQWFVVVAIIILAISMFAVAYVIFRYGSSSEIDPCGACESFGYICQQLKI